MPSKYNFLIFNRLRCIKVLKVAFIPVSCLGQQKIYGGGVEVQRQRARASTQVSHLRGRPFFFPVVSATQSHRTDWGPLHCVSSSNGMREPFHASPSLFVCRALAPSPSILPPRPPYEELCFSFLFQTGCFSFRIHLHAA